LLAANVEEDQFPILAVQNKPVEPLPGASEISETGDFNGNGNSDILWRDSGGNLAIWFMNGAQLASSGSLANIPTVWAIQGANAD
jgi:hypothetical protein